MKKHLFTALILLILGTVVYAQSAPTVRILPKRWSINTTGKGRVKAEIRNIDTKSVDTSSIFMNGIAPLRTRVTPNKIMAFFSKRDVLGTLGTLQPGQVVSISLAFTAASAPNTLSGDVTLVKGKNSGHIPTGAGNH